MESWVSSHFIAWNCQQLKDTEVILHFHWDKIRNGLMIEDLRHSPVLWTLRNSLQLWVRPFKEVVSQCHRKHDRVANMSKTCQIQWCQILSQATWSVWHQKVFRIVPHLSAQNKWSIALSATWDEFMGGDEAQGSELNAPWESPFWC